MKKLIYIVTIILFSTSYAQEYNYLDFFGIEDSTGNTHLVYRKHFSNNSRHFYKLNLVTDEEIFLASDGIRTTPHSQTGERVYDLEYFNNSANEFIYSGVAIGYYDNTGYIHRSDKDNVFNIAFGGVDNVEISKQNENIIFATLQDVFIKSTDRGYTWPSFQSGFDSTYIVEFPLVSLSPFDDNIMYGIDADGHLLRSINQGEASSVVISPIWSTDLTDIFYDNDKTHIYATTKSNTGYEIRISDNNGESNSWSNLITASDEIIFCINDSLSGEIYYSTDKSVYQSVDYGNNFLKIKDFDVRITGLYKKPNSNLLYISTYYKIYELNTDTDEITLIRTITDFDPLKYYPLQVGNTWVYNTRGWDNSLYNTFNYDYKKVVVRKATQDNGQEYFVIKENGKEYYERYDLSNTKVWMYYLYSEANDNQEFLSYDLSTIKGDSIRALFSDYYLSQPASFVHVDDSLKFLFNKSRHVKFYEIYNTNEIYDIQLAKNIGIYYKEEGWDYGVRKTTLKGCVINGIVYGDTSLVVSVEYEESIPNKISLEQNYPNPFNPSTTIKFSIPNVMRSGTSHKNTKLTVFDILGREIKTLLNKPMQPGSYEIEFDGSTLPSGVYFYVLENAGKRLSKKMLILK